MIKSAEYKQEVMDWRMQEEERIQSSIDILTDMINGEWRYTKKDKFPFLAHFVDCRSTSRVFSNLIALLHRMKDSVKHPELTDKNTGLSFAMLSHSEVSKYTGGRKSKAGTLLYFLLLAGFITRTKAEDVKSQEFRDRMKSFTSEKKQQKMEKEAKSFDIKETSLLCVPSFTDERLSFIESRLQTLDKLHARRSGLTYGYIYTIFGQEVADSIFPFNQGLSDKMRNDIQQISDMKAFVLGKIKTYGFFRLQMFKSFKQLGRNGKEIKRGFNYSHWKLVQAILISEGHFVYERAGQVLIESAISDKDQYSKDITKKCLTKENGRMKCPCILVDRWKYMEYKFQNAKPVPLRHKKDMQKYTTEKTSSFQYGF